VDLVTERFVVEIRPTEDGRVVGTVGRPGAGEVVAFSGWMDLLRLLEPRSPDAVTR
jgi:hypothetical protein